jgi:hypothetical protein
MICSNIPKCGRLVHKSCYDEKVKMKYTLEEIEDCAFCTKKCQDKYAAGHKPVTRYTFYNDGMLGPNDPNCSANLLIQWLKMECNKDGTTNYHRFRCGSANNGKTKNAIAQQCADWLNDQGIQDKKDEKAVLNKIQDLEKNMTAAIDWANGTGAGLEEGDTASSFREAVMLRCRHYYDLIDIMCDRARFVPKVTTDDADWQHAGTKSDGDEAAGDDGGQPTCARAKKNTASTSKEGTTAARPPKRRKKAPEGTDPELSPTPNTDGKLEKLSDLRIEVMEQRKKALAEANAAPDDTSKYTPHQKAMLCRDFMIMAEGLGKVRAAKVEPKFVMFLSPKEQKELADLDKDE